MCNQSTKESSLLELPAETLDRILSNMDLCSVANLGMSSSNKKLHECIRQRKNPLLHLGKIFKYPISVLVALGDYGSAICGSFALEYFCPGSMSASSGCDIYVFNSNTCILGIMNVLEDSGCIWDDLVPGLYELLIEQKKSVVTAKVTDVLDVLYCIVDQQGYHNMEDTHLKQCYREMTRLVHYLGYCGMVSLTLEDDGYKIQELESAPTTPSLGSTMLNPMYETEEIRTITGCINRDSSKIPIRLIIQQYSPGIFGSIVRSYASHIQCFITGTHAFHLYPQSLRNKHALHWIPVRLTNSLHRNREEDKYIDLSIEKYTDRGFKFTTGSTGISVRHLNDKNTLGINFRQYYDDLKCIQPISNKKDLDAFFLHRQINIDTLSWLQTRICLEYLRIRELTCENIHIMGGIQMPQRICTRISLRVAVYDSRASTMYLTQRKKDVHWYTINRSQNHEEVLSFFI